MMVDRMAGDNEYHEAELLLPTEVTPVLTCGSNVATV